MFEVGGSHLGYWDMLTKGWTLERTCVGNIIHPRSYILSLGIAVCSYIIVQRNEMSSSWFTEFEVPWHHVMLKWYSAQVCALSVSQDVQIDNINIQYFTCKLRVCMYLIFTMLESRDESNPFVRISCCLCYKLWNFYEAFPPLIYGECYQTLPLLAAAAPHLQKFKFPGAQAADVGEDQIRWPL